MSLTQRHSLPEPQIELPGLPHAQPRVRPLRLRVHSALRWLHIYISMASLLIVLFFALTGVTLNHPEWLFGTSEAIVETEGVLPEGWNAGGEVDWLLVVEHFRQEHGVRGALSDYRADELEGMLAFKAPGYAADAFFDPETGSYQLSTATQGFVGLMNELHRGKDAATSWKLAIDIAGIVLAVLAVTGIGLLLYLKRYRRSALVTMAAGIALSVLLMYAVT